MTVPFGDDQVLEGEKRVKNDLKQIQREENDQGDNLEIKNNSNSETFEETEASYEEMSSENSCSLPDEFFLSEDEDTDSPVNENLYSDLYSLGPISFINKAIDSGYSPTDVLRTFGFKLPPQYLLDEEKENVSLDSSLRESKPLVTMGVWSLVREILLRYVYFRPKLSNFENLDCDPLNACASLIKSSNRILLLLVQEYLLLPAFLIFVHQILVSTRRSR